MDKIAIIGANSFQNPLILKAKEMGYETHVFAWKTGDIGEKTADYFYPISITEKEKILEECKRIKPKAIVSIGSDLAVITVNYIAKELGLVANNPENSLICTNKYEMRKALKNSNIKTPNFIKVGKNSKIDINDLEFPLIVKPTDRSGSRGIMKVTHKEELDFAIQEAIKNSFEKMAIIEEYIDGEEYSCECISYKGIHTCLAITKKFTTGAPHFIETGHVEPSGLSNEQMEKIKIEVFNGLNALKIENGASHTEFKLKNNGEIGIIEIGARMGGDCIGSDLVKISTGYDFLRLTIDVALGKEPKFDKVCNPKIAMIKFIFSKDDVRKLNIIEEKFKDAIYYKSSITDLNNEIVDSSTRYGYYILQIDNNEQLEMINNI